MGRLAKPGAALGAALLLIVGGGAYAVASSSGGTITVCVSHQGGALYKAMKCAKHDRKLTWNKQGVAGPRGLRGTNGTNGAPGTARAYAHVMPGIPPSLDPTYTHGFTAVSHALFTGGYCLTPATGVNPASYPAVAVGEWDGSGGSAPYLAMVSNGRSDCSAGQYEVITFQGSSPAASDLVAFNLIVP